MWTLWRTLTLGYIAQRWTRSALIVVSIALGVAAMVATRTLNETMNETARGAGTPFAGSHDLIVVNGQAGMPAAVADQLASASIAGLEQAWPFSVAQAAVPELPSCTALLVGVPFDAAQSGANDIPDIKIEWTAGPLDWLRIATAGATPAVVGVDLDEKLRAGGLSRGFHLRIAGHEQAVEAVGIVRLAGPAAALGGRVVFLPLSDAGRLIFPLRPDFISRINLRVAPGGDAIAVQRAAQACIGTQAEVRTAAADNAATSDVTAGLEMGVAIGGAAALVVGMFLVYNALSVSVAERRRDIGILRSTGATRGQIVGLFIGEAMLLGLAGAACGLPSGLGLGWLALQLLGHVLGEMIGVAFNARGLPDSMWTLLLAAGAGVVTAMLAALVPAVRAALEEPADAVRRVPPSARGLLLTIHIALCLALGGAGAACVFWRGCLPGRTAAFAGITLLLLTALVATPLAAGLAGRLLQPFARRLFGLEGRLAADNLVRSPGRTGLVIAALAATSALFVMTAGFIYSTEQTVLTWLDEQVAADLFVTGGGTFSNVGSMVALPDRLADRVKEMPEIAAVLPVRLYQLDFRGHFIVLIAPDFAAFRASAGDRPLARNFARFPRLSEPGTVLLSENFAALYAVGVGEDLQVNGPRGPLRLEVIGIVPDYTWNRGAIIVDRSWFRTVFEDDQIDVIDVFLYPGNDPAVVREQLVREGERDFVVSQTSGELRQDVSVALHRVYSLAYAQQVVIGLVALLGVVSALFISVLQRTRELGLLRAVGATRGQVLRSVLAEATLMGIVGAAIGFGVGLLLEWYVVKVLLLADAGWVFPLHVPWLAASIVIGSSVLTATLVGLWPAVHATRLRIPEAIAYE